MNLKQRFAFLFTSFVAVILFIACTTIYFLYAGYRQNEFYNRISLEGNEVYEFFQESKNVDSLTKASLFKELLDRTIFNERLIIVDSTGKQVFMIPSNQHEKLPDQLKDKAKKTKRYQYTDKDQVQHVVEFHIPSKSFIYVSGFDQIGLDKLKNLQLILIAVFLGGLILTSVLSFLFVKEAIRPIVQLSKQMQLTNVKNLSERIAIKSAKDEISLIANNFNAMMDRLKSAFESQKTFVHHASHELRTPLAVMLSQTEFALANDHSKEAYIEVLLSLKEEQQHMIELANSLLLLSQYETAKFDTDWPVLRIDEMLFESIAVSRRLYPDIIINFSFASIPENDTQLCLKCNESLIKSAFSNLIKNGYQYSSDQKVDISLFFKDGFIGISFTNRGTQLSNEEITKLSLSFFRGQNASGKKGFGLGLSIIERILAIHHGEMKYQAEGTDLNVFTIKFPIFNKG
jgi:signal transduction histidine kinase